ncbi:MAG: hypothetical protein K0R24_1468 [Gammaproteobacteria bacterium]|jgi:hypothetical protein|nr:hypothetical protein [Gammaproteobacteria bacterium]
MAKGILAVSPYASNPVSHIAYLIFVALKRRSGYPPASQKEFQQTLATVVGLAFTAILHEGSRVEVCKPHLDFFLKYRRATSYIDNLEILSVSLPASVAEIICHAIHPFRVLGRPNYYADFMEMLVALLKSSSDEDPEGEKEIIAMLLRDLFSLCH